jgi:arsenate reductase
MLLENIPNKTVNSSVNHRPINILILCTGNSARSIMAEAIFNSLGAPVFRAVSAGSKPVGRVHPLALEQIRQLNVYQEDQFYSKSWDEFALINAPKLDIVLTVCDNAASETCPTFVGQYQRIHWSLPDPAGVSADIESEREAFSRCFHELYTRVAELITYIKPKDSCQTIARAMRKWN